MHEKMSKIMKPVEQVPNSILIVMNQVYEMEQKLKKRGDDGGLQRNVNKMRDAFLEYGLAFEDPMGQALASLHL